MAKDDSEVTTISQDSIACLEEVKKGKPRKFAMICKGTSIVSLVIYKKGNVEKRKKEAKEGGKGQFYFGVVDGKGIDICFALARSDGFEGPPVKNAVLKGFLEESADFKCKPRFEIVDATSLVLDEDDPLVIRFVMLQDKAFMACETNPDRASQISDICKQIGGCLDREQMDEAAAKLNELESLLAKLATSTSSPAPSAAPPAAEQDGSLEVKLVEALKKLRPLLVKAIELHPIRKTELLGLASKVGEEIRNKRFNQAQTDILTLGKLAKSLCAELPASAPQATSADADVLGRLKTMSTGIKALLAGPNASQVKPLVGAVKAMVASKDFAQAGKLLDELGVLVGSMPKSDSSPDATKRVSLVELGKTRLEWESVRGSAIKEIQRLTDILTQAYAGDASEQQALSASRERLTSTIAALNEDLGDRLDDVLNAAPEHRSSHSSAAIRVLEKFIKFVDSDEIMSAIDGNEYAPDMRVAEPLRNKLKSIVSALG